MPRATFATPALAGLAVVALGAGPASSQALSGSTLSATIAQRLEADTNYNLDDPSPGTSYFADTRVTLGLLSETADRTFELGVDTGLRALWEADEDFEFTFASPTTASLGYDQAWANATLGADFSFRAAELDSSGAIFVDSDDNGVPDSLQEVDNNVTEYRSDAAIDFAFATDSPSSYAFSLSATNFDYSETNADQVPRTTVQGDALWTLRLNPVLSGALNGTYYFYDGQDDQDTQVNVGEIDAGVIYEPNETLVLRAGLGFADRTREETDVATGVRSRTEDERGPTARFGFDYDMDDFQVFATARVTTAAPKTRFIGNMTVLYPLARGTVSARVFQTYFGDSSGDESRFTGANIGLEHEINSVSSLGFDVGVAQQANQDDPSEPDIERLNASVTYSYALTEVVTADVGYRYAKRREDPEDADSNAFFVQIGRTFETNP